MQEQWNNVNVSIETQYSETGLHWKHVAKSHWDFDRQKREPVEWARGRAVGKICLGGELGVNPSVKDEAEKTESFLGLLEWQGRQEGKTAHVVQRSHL